MGYEIKHYTPDVLALRCAERLIDLTVTPLPTLLFISGGSALTVIEKFISILTTKKANLHQLTIAFVDERFDPQSSNYSQLLERFPSLIAESKMLGASWIDTRPTKTDQYQMAEWYEEEIKTEELRVKNHQGRIITLLGMGTDGHIAGIMPYTETEKQLFYSTFMDTRNLVVGYDATGKNEFTQRFTATFPGLLQSDYVVAYITGEEKKKALSRALHESPKIHRCPAVFLTQTPQPCEIFTEIEI